MELSEEAELVYLLELQERGQSLEGTLLRFSRLLSGFLFGLHLCKLLHQLLITLSLHGCLLSFTGPYGIRETRFGVGFLPLGVRRERSRIRS